METYGFSKLLLRNLTEKKEPDTTKPIITIDGTPKKGATSSFDLTGLTKAPVKVYGSDVEYFVVRKGTGDVAANFGLLDLDAKEEGGILGFVEAAEGIQGMGNDSEAPVMAAVAQSEDLYGEPVAFAMVAGTFSRDGFSLATKNDEEFKPEAGEYVYTAMSRKLKFGEPVEGAEDSGEKVYKVLRAFGAEPVKKLIEVVLGTDTVTEPVSK